MSIGIDLNSFERKNTKRVGPEVRAKEFHCRDHVFHMRQLVDARPSGRKAPEPSACDFHQHTASTHTHTHLPCDRVSAC